MKPLQVVLLVVVSALAGGLFMKWQISRNTAPAAASAATVAQPATPATVQPVAQPSQPAEPVEPTPTTPRKETKISARPHEVLKSHRAAPVMLAQRDEPATAEPAVDAPPAAVTLPIAQTAPPAPDAEPVHQAPPQPDQPAQQPDPVASIPAAPQPPQVTLKAGLLISARTGQGLSSDHNSPGDGFTATLDQQLVADGWVIAEKGARLEGKVVETGRGRNAELVVVLTQIRTSDGQRIAIETETYAKHAQLANGDTAGKVLAGTVIGAAIGAIAGGGKGAAIGAGAGTAAGAGVATATRARPAVLPAETLIHFRLKNSVTITERQGRS